MKKTSAAARAALVKVCLSLALSVLFLALSIVSWCWLAHITEVGAHSPDIAMMAFSSVDVMRAKILKRDGLEGARDVSALPAISMSEYDPIFPEKNVNTPIIIRVELGVAPIEIEGHEEPVYPDLYLDFHCSNTDGNDVFGWLETDSGVRRMTPLLSNIVDFRFACVDPQMLETLEQKNGVPSDEAIYDGAISYLRDKPVYAFVSQDPSSQAAYESGDTSVTMAQKNDEPARYYKKTSRLSIKLPVEEYFDNIIRDGELEYLVVYLEINYNNDYVSAYSDQHGIDTNAFGHNESEGGYGTIQFKNDISSFYFHMGEATANDTNGEEESNS
ncbi:MAG: hypothetical protein KBS76_05440 [Ruminococcus sp.]|nr:hypothetical protein [Candidatus Apopatosoma intestinale]